MALGTVRLGTGSRAVVVEGDVVTTLPYEDVGQLLAATDGVLQLDGQAGERLDAASLTWAPVVPKPEKIICVGHNYLAHIREMGREPPAFPSLFAKFHRSLIGANDPIRHPGFSDTVDWEAELAVIVGREARNLPVEEARSHIAGYTVINDVSVREYQWRTTQYLQGKTFEGMSPIGPVIVAGEEIDWAQDLHIECRVNGEVVQEASTSDMVFNAEHVLSYISRFVTLVPGDVLALGTPSGVGAGRKPPRYLQPGEVLETSIEGIGKLVNRCAAADESHVVGSAIDSASRLGSLAGS